MRRLLLAVVVLAFPISALTVGLAGPASAAGVKPSASGVVCSAFRGDADTGISKLRKCSDTKNTGGKGKFPLSTYSGSGTITWNGTGTTTLGSVTLMPTTTNACPTGIDEEEMNATVTGGTGAAAKSIKTNWSLQAFFCNAKGNLTLVAGTAVEIGADF
jgi:hypothetical protein